MVCPPHVAPFPLSPCSDFPSSFTRTFGKSFPRLTIASLWAIFLIYAPAHADDRNRCSINYAWNHIPPVPLLLITVSLLHYLCQRNYTESGPVYRKTSNLSSAAMRNTQIKRKLMCNCGFIFTYARLLSHVGLIISRQHAGLFRSLSLHPLSLKHCFPTSATEKLRR